jgi:transcriptional regulator with XRE-family HTH domain
MSRQNPEYASKDERDCAIIASYNAGYGLRQLSSQFSLSQPAIRKILINAGAYKYEFGAAQNRAQYFAGIRAEQQPVAKRKRARNRQVRTELVALRDAKGYDQQQIADLLGISREYYNRIENNHATPSDTLWERIEAVYGLTAGDTEIRRASPIPRQKSQPRSPTTTAAKKPSEDRTRHRAFAEMTAGYDSAPYCGIPSEYRSCGFRTETYYEGTDDSGDGLFARVSYYESIPTGEDGGGKPTFKSDHHKDYAIIHGCWAHITPSKKKNINGRRFKILERYDTRPEGMSEETASAIFKKLRP